MIICSASNIDLIQGTLGYGDNTEGVNITDWRISNTQSAIAGQSGVFNIFNSTSITPSISIVDSGTVGIGTVPSVSSASKMEIVGNVNITGAYNINNRNVIADTSNYVLSTSNALVARIIASGGSGGALTSGGNLTLSNNATSNTVLSIANSNVVYGTIQGTSNYTSNVITGTAFVATFADANVPSTHAQVTDTPTDRYMIFTTANVNHTFTVPTGGLVCDILMIGGGGAGLDAGGGGAGACVVSINKILPAGSCVVNVGAGGATNGVNGGDSFIQVANADRYRAKGGGTNNGSDGYAGFAGGCGGGATWNNDTTTEAGGAAVGTNVVTLSNGFTATGGANAYNHTELFAMLGNSGGNNGTVAGTGGSGGGIGATGVAGGNGGNGKYDVTINSQTYNFRNYFANGGTLGVLNSTDSQYYIGGGGSSRNGTSGLYGNGGLGGGGGTGGGSAGVANTGSGGSGNSNPGGSGIIIIRYRTGITITPTPTSVPITIPTTTFGVPTIELIRGISGDNNLDYKLGNYDGNFKIMSSISSIDTDRLSINSSTNSTALSIINRDIVVATTPATSGLVNALTTTGSPTIGTIGTTDRYMIFTASGSFTVPTGGINCDILMIGGGGAGGYYAGGGGGAGACIVAINQTLTTAGSYTVNVGAGEIGTSGATGAGGDSSIVLSGTTLYLAKGGGRGEAGVGGRNNGGCGGGAAYGAIKTGGTALNTNIVNGIITGPTLSSTFVVLGNKGGDRPDSTSGVSGVGGGGIGGPGGNHIISSINAGPGGVGVNQVAINGITYNFKSYFAGGTTFGNNNDGFIGGGGGGSVYTNSVSLGPNVGGIGGIGGGGAGGITSTFVAATGAAGPAVNAVAGTANTGGGGGGGWRDGGIGGNGGSGIVIVRYRVATAVVGVPSVELIRGVAGDSNHDYKVGNYDGNFKIMSSVSGATDAERINITSVGNVGIGTSSPANELHIFDSTTSATSLIIQNNNMMMTSNTTQGTSTTQGTGAPVTSYSDGSFADNKPSVHEQVTSSTDRIMIFRTAGVNHTFTVPAGGLVCDILMIGGGGGGGGSCGGGAGACIIAINQTLTEGTYQVYLGSGGPSGSGNNPGSNGSESYIYRNSYGNLYNARGGGGGGANGFAGFSGGCGGGAGYGTSVNLSGGQAVSTNTVAGNTNIGPFTSATTYSVMGNNGGGNAGSSSGAGGGGGIGEPGATPGVGGNGRYDKTINGTTYNFRNHFANGGNNFGVLSGGNYYIGGGGGGAAAGSAVSGGLGGAGSSGTSPVANTGSGGYSYDTGGASGIIIIRYKNSTIPFPTTTTPTTYTHTPTSTTTLTTTLGTPSIELVRGTQGDSNTDYKIGNYSGDFIVKSSVSGVDTDYLKISSIGAITNPTGTASWNTGSDRRIKENIERASYDKCYDNINKLELNRFNYIKGFNTVNRDITQLGFIAQEVYDIFPKAISTNGYYSDTLIIPDLLSIDVTQINYTLYGAVKKLMEINKDKEMRLKRLEGLLNIEDSGSSGNLLDTSNIAIDTSNIAIDTSNLLDTSNIAIDTSNIAIDSSNIVIESSNVVIDITPDDILSSNMNI